MLTRVVFRTLQQPVRTTTKCIQPCSHLNSSDFSEPFSGQPKASTAEELRKYEQYLIKHNTSLKKPHQKLRTEEERIVLSCLQQQHHTQLLDFLFNNSNRRLCSISTAATVDSTLAAAYQSLTLQNKKKAAYSLVSFREPKLFSLFKKQLQRQIMQSDLDSIDAQSLFIYLYGQIITYKKLDFFCLLLARRQINYKQAIEKLYQSLFYRIYKGIYQTDYKALLSYLQLVINPNLNKLELYRDDKQRSHLQSLVQSFLRVLGYQNLRECTINNYNVDFLVGKQGQGQKIALQVDGNYHYTLGGKLKGKQVLRNLIINQGAPLRIVHQQELLLSRGHRNKMAYIEHLLGLKEVNWESKEMGIDSGWQVSDVEGMVNFPAK